MTEGPCLVVLWFDRGLPSVEQTTRYFPSSRCSAVLAEDFMLGWMRSHGCVIRSMLWAWGEVPRALPKGRMLAGR